MSDIRQALRDDELLDYFEQLCENSINNSSLSSDDSEEDPNCEIQFESDSSESESESSEDIQGSADAGDSTRNTTPVRTPIASPHRITNDCKEKKRIGLKFKFQRPIQPNMSHCSSAIEFYRLFFNDEILDLTEKPPQYFSPEEAKENPETKTEIRRPSTDEERAAHCTKINRNSGGSETPKGLAAVRVTATGGSSSVVSESDEVPKITQQKDNSYNTESSMNKNKNWIQSSIDTERNRFEILNGTVEEIDVKQKKEKPPPIFPYGIENYQEMRLMIEKVVSTSEYTYRIVRGKQTIINTSTIENYKKVLEQIRAAKLIHHTFPSKEDKNYRVVLKEIYPTHLNEEILREEFAKEGHIIKKSGNMKNYNNVTDRTYFLMRAGLRIASQLKTKKQKRYFGYRKHTCNTDKNKTLSTANLKRKFPDNLRDDHDDPTTSDNSSSSCFDGCFSISNSIMTRIMSKTNAEAGIDTINENGESTSSSSVNDNTVSGQNEIIMDEIPYVELEPNDGTITKIVLMLRKNMMILRFLILKPLHYKKKKKQQKLIQTFLTPPSSVSLIPSPSPLPFGSSSSSRFDLDQSSLSLPLSSDCDIDRAVSSDNSTPVLESSDSHIRSHYKQRKFLFGCSIPFAVVNFDIFKKFISIIRPAYTKHIPDRKKLGTDLLDKVYNKYKNKNKKNIGGESVLVIDGWKNSSKNTKNVVTMIHNPTGGSTFVKNFDFSETSETTDELQTVVSEAKTLASEWYNTNVYAIISDNAANMISMGKKIDEWHTTCHSKTGNLLLKDIVNKDVNEKIVSLIKLFKRPEFEQKIFAVGGKKLILPGEIRWCSYRDAYGLFFSNPTIMKHIAVDNEEFSPHKITQDKKDGKDDTDDNALSQDCSTVTVAVRNRKKSLRRTVTDFLLENLCGNGLKLLAEFRQKTGIF
ncbi:hypothetical protein PGB90_003479 [Kerria lacca]